MLYKEKQEAFNILGNYRPVGATERTYERRLAVDKEYLYKEEVAGQLKDVRGEFIKTKSGLAYARVGYYILTDTKTGDEWVCNSDTFDSKFEEVKE